MKPSSWDAFETSRTGVETSLRRHHVFVDYERNSLLTGTEPRYCGCPNQKGFSVPCNRRQSLRTILLFTSKTVERQVRLPVERSRRFINRSLEFTVHRVSHTAPKITSSVTPSMFAFFESKRLQRLLAGAHTPSGEISPLDKVVLAKVPHQKMRRLFSAVKLATLGKINNNCPRHIVESGGTLS